MWTCRLQVLLLVVCLPFVFCAPANAQYLNDPYVVASGGGAQWWSDAAYNPARNEYGMTWQNEQPAILGQFLALAETSDGSVYAAGVRLAAPGQERPLLRRRRPS